MKNRKLLLIGWDAADWKVIHPLLDSGKMPNLQKLISNGVMGNLASLKPELSPMLWTSVATGKRPYKHGILGFSEPGFGGKGVRAVTNLSRKTKAIWNILNQNNYRSLVVGWWPSHPAEPINGVMVSNQYQHATGPYGTSWPVQDGTIHPPRLIDNLRKLRVHPQELDQGLIQLFVPDLVQIDQDKDHRIEGIAKIIADTETINRAATALMHHEKWDFTAVYFDAIDHFCHGFMNYYPPRLSWVGEDDYQLYKQVVISGYEYHDLLLGSLLTETDKDTTVILVSDHGFHSDKLRPAQIPGEPTGPASHHRPYGIVVLSGPDIKKDELVFGSSLLDICPTILSIFDLPVGSDMDGRVLVNAFTELSGCDFIPSWDEIPGEDGSHSPSLYANSLGDTEAVTRLVELGYIDRPDPDLLKAAANAERELEYNLARSYIDAGLHGEALPVLTTLLEQWPDEFRFGVELAHCYQSVGKATRARKLLSVLFEKKQRKAEEAEKELERLRKEIEQSDIKKKKLEELQPQIRTLLESSSRNQHGIAYLLGVALHAEGKCEDALDSFEKAEKEGMLSAALFIQKGAVFETLKLRNKAQQSYNKALSIDTENCDAMLGLCRVYLASRQNKDAAHKALDAIALRYHFPLAHFYLGCALHRLGRLGDAVTALEVALEQNPNIPEACHRLAYIYKKRLHMEERAVYYKKLAHKAVQRIRELRKGTLQEMKPVPVTVHTKTGNCFPLTTENAPPNKSTINSTIVIVSGLPRSGTSMLMQMLEAGGMPVLSDGHRQKNADNSKGYFEYERVKRLVKENGWLLGHGGKAVKIIAQLLPFLPESEKIQYRVLFMERDLDEILRSQEKMLENLGQTRKRIPEKLIKNDFLRQVETMKSLLSIRKIPVLYVCHQDCILKASTVAGTINQFLGHLLDPSAMEAVVDETLYRQRKTGI